VVPLGAATLRDRLGGAAAGCPPHLVRSGRAAELDSAALERIVEQVPDTRVHRDLAAFAEWMLTRDHVVDSGVGALPVT
jgi:D-glycero-D-manno-heptose 1,7-bisphosphate phosphatase